MTVNIELASSQMIFCELQLVRLAAERGE